MDVLATRASSSCGRTTPRRTAKSCGPDTPTLVSSAQMMISRVMGARKPGSQLFDSHISELQSGPVFDAAEGFEA